LTSDIKTQILVSAFLPLESGTGPRFPKKASAGETACFEVASQKSLEGPDDTDIKKVDS
jgi:hypothetical protein